ncbi:MAG: tyrosine-type recombinase/integrase [Dermatophilaceae bacterium]
MVTGSETNVKSAFRRVRTDTELEWVFPHTCRQTVATMLDQTGLSARTIADQLGHSRISMTQDVYMGRCAVDESAAAALEASWHQPTPTMLTPPNCLRYCNYSGRSGPCPSGGQ